VTPDERWLAAVLPFVRGQLPAAPARVAEIGCGPLGGFVPMLRAGGYEAAGIDPEAPQGPGYHRVEFERYEMPQPADAIVACTSLHHVADLGAVLDLAEAALVPGGRLVIVEWAWERFDEPTARWCFDRLPPAGTDPGWLHQQRAEWRDSGQPWDAHFSSWAAAEGLHTGLSVLRELGARFGSGPVTYGPYFFPELSGISEAGEQAAIDAGQIRAGRIQYLGRRPNRSAD
jgi:SAM-dependent methyltransferase